MKTLLQINTILRFLGMADVTFVHAEGLALGDTPKQSALAQAHAAIARLAA